jgi:hypothetical protein
MATQRVPFAFLLGLGAAMILGWFGLPAILYESIEQPLQFSHALHTGDDVCMDCESCHGFDAEGHFTGTPSVEVCAGCHDECLGESEDEKTLVAHYIVPSLQIPWLVYARQPDNVHFPHAQHVRLAELPCERCHGPHDQTEKLRPFERNLLSGYSRDIWGRNISGISTEQWDGMKMGDCSHCHREQGVVESCLDCHK